uniref:EGF-like domain-containing protein n=1 Tax=Plectus sambesii TaxID=2011161 RepID=A0A914VRV0_9BILA
MLSLDILLIFLLEVTTIIASPWSMCTSSSTGVLTTKCSQTIRQTTDQEMSAYIASYDTTGEAGCCVEYGTVSIKNTATGYKMTCQCNAGSGDSCYLEFDMDDSTNFQNMRHLRTKCSSAKWQTIFNIRLLFLHSYTFFLSNINKFNDINDHNYDYNMDVNFNTHNNDNNNSNIHNNNHTYYDYNTYDNHYNNTYYDYDYNTYDDHYNNTHYDYDYNTYYDYDYNTYYDYDYNTYYDYDYNTYYDYDYNTYDNHYNNNYYDYDYNTYDNHYNDTYNDHNY